MMTSLEIHGLQQKFLMKSLELIHCSNLQTVFLKTVAVVDVTKHDGPGHVR